MDDDPKILYIATIGTTLENESESPLLKPNLEPFLLVPWKYPLNRFYKIYLLNEMDPNRLREELSQRLSQEHFTFLKETIYTIKIDPFDFLTVMEAILKIIKENYDFIRKNNPQIIVNITGGTKLMVIGGIYGALMVDATIQYIKKPREDSSNDLQSQPEFIELKIPPLSIKEIAPLQKAIILGLYTNMEKQLTQSSLKNYLEKDFHKKLTELGYRKKTISTQVISYNCIQLERLGLIKRIASVENKREVNLQLTEMGRIFAQYYQIFFPPGKKR